MPAANINCALRRTCVNDRCVIGCRRLGSTAKQPEYHEAQMILEQEHSLTRYTAS